MSEPRLDEDEALLLLTNRILLDFISLQVDSGAMTVAQAKNLVSFSATEVKRGAPSLTDQVDFFSEVIRRRFDETDYSKSSK